MKVKIIDIQGKLYNELGMYGGRGHYSNVLGTDNGVVFSGIIWETQPFKYQKKYVNSIFTFLRKINKFFGNPHFHNYLPFVSFYLSFHRRKIGYKCKCGKKKVKEIYRGFSEEFPIKTNNLLSENEFNQLVK